MALEDPQAARDKLVGSHPAKPFRALILPRAGGLAPAGLKVAGITVVERQRRQLLRLGAVVVANAATLESAPAAPLLLIESGLIADERLIAAFLHEAGQRPARSSPLIAIGPDGVPGGLAWFPDGRMLADGRVLADWADLAVRAQPVDLSGTGTYSPERRRHVPLLWERPIDAVSAAKTANKLLAAAQKGCLDWPARFIHPPFENAIVRLLWPTAITPNMISLLAFLLGLYAAWCFASGALWTGLLLALIVGPIDGIDGKLARTRMEFSRWGDLEHVGDKIVEYAWIAGLAAAIGTGAAWALAALIVCTALAEALQGEFYRRITGAQLDDAGRFERGYRLISGRRNTFFWSLLPFAWFDAWAAGLVMIAAYSALNFFVMQIRFFVRLAEYGRENSATIAKNLAATAYRTAGPDKSGDDAAARPVRVKAIRPRSSRLGLS